MSLIHGERPIIEMVPNEDGVYEPVGEIQEPIRREKKKRADRVYRNQVRDKRQPQTFLDGFGEGIRLVGGMRRKIEDYLNDALGEEER